MSKYSKVRGINDEPAFTLSVDFTLKKRERIISAINKRYHKRNSKFGIKVPKTVEEAFRFDHENGDTLWHDTIAKEMKNVQITFKIGEVGDPNPFGHQQIRCHMIFDIKIENFKRKARFVAGGHTIEAPATLTYASVVSRERVRIALNS